MCRGQPDRTGVLGVGAWGSRHGSNPLLYVPSPPNQNIPREGQLMKTQAAQRRAWTCLLPPRGPHAGLLFPALARSPSLPLREGASLVSWVKE